MSAYRQTLQLALAGAQGPLPSTLASLAAEWGEAETPAQALYHAAAMLTQAERSARPLPRRADPGPEPAALETLKPPDDLLASLLGRSSSNPPNPFVEQDKAELLIARGEHLPFVLLPGWLDHTITRPVAEQAVLLACTGQRGAWLADLNPKWRALLACAPDDGLWETGSLPERCAWLTAQRSRDPAAGRTALKAVWADEPPETREKLLSCLSTGLAIDDEPLLETARTDKRREVRQLALGLLSRLPQSAFAQRMLTRLTEWLDHAPGGLLRSARLDVRLPAAYDKAWALDGIPEKTTRQREGIGDKANWLVEAMGYVSLEQLLDRLRLAPAALAKLIDGQEYADALWTGCIESYERWPSPMILEALGEVPKPMLRLQLQRISLHQAASATSPDPWLTPLIERAFDLGLWLTMLRRLDARWSRTLLKRLSSTIDQHRAQPTIWGDLLLRFAERVHAEVLPDFLALLDPLGNEPGAGKAVTAAVEIADLRHKLHQYRPAPKT